MDKILTQDCFLETNESYFTNGAALLEGKWYEKKTGMIVLTVEQVKEIYIEGYKRRNSNNFSRDWEEFKIEHNL